MAIKLNFYAGKNMDSMGSSFNMLLEAGGFNQINWLDCISLKAFRLKASSNEPFDKWFMPAVDSETSICAILDILELKENFFYTKINKDDRIRENIKSAMGGRSGILGPLSKKDIIEKLDSYFYKGDAHFIYIVTIEENEIIVHEPDGSPYFRLTTIEFEKAIVNWDGNTYFVGLKDQKPKNIVFNFEKILKNTLIKGIKYRIDTRLNKNHLSLGIKYLVEYLTDNKLKSSQEAGLGFAFCNISLFYYRLFEFLNDLRSYISSGNLVMQIEKIMDLFQVGYSNIANLQEKMKVKDPRFLDCLKELSNLEMKLDENFEEFYFQTLKEGWDEKLST